MKDKKGMSFIIPIAVFVAIFIGALIIGIVISKLSNEILNPFATQVGTMSPVAETNVDFVLGSFNNFWDWAILIFFLSQIMLLFLSAFLIDTHPVFLIFYIIACAFLMMFISDLLNPVNIIYEGVHFTNNTAMMPMTDAVRTNFPIILLGIMILSGVVIYAKIKYFGANK